MPQVDVHEIIRELETWPTVADYCANCGEDRPDHDPDHCAYMPRPYTENIVASDLISDLVTTTGMDRHDLYRIIARAAHTMGLGPTS